MEPAELRKPADISDASPYRKILVATDLSERAEQLIRSSAFLMSALHTSVVVVTVSNVPTSVKGNETDGFPANPEERRIADGLRRILDQSFHESSDQIDIKVLHGDPAQRIVEYAEYAAADLIVIGSRGQGSLKRAVLGSVSESVINKSRKPVLIVR